MKQKSFVIVDSQRNKQFSTMKEASLSTHPVLFFNYKKNIIENRNYDICVHVTDSRARAVVVVKYAEKLGFSCRGFSSTTTKIFVDETGIVMNF